MVNQVSEEVQPPPPPQPHPLSIFTDEFLLLLASNRIQACGPLSEALDVLADRGLLTLYCPDARPIRMYGQNSGSLAFQAPITSACHNGNVQLNSEIGHDAWDDLDEQSMLGTWDDLVERSV